MPESARIKISDAQKKRWQDPQFRANVTAAMKGKPAWNKGRTVSDETREKMRLAKLNRSLSKVTRDKMSAARQGKSLSPEAAALVSAKLTGRPKSEEHKAAIAATQRRRYAAVRVLKAVEAVYSQGGSGDANGASPPRGVAAMKRERSQALNAFKSELREYRSLQEELSPWTKAFLERHGRKPTTVDVQNTGITWLISRYKQYIYLRERIFTETSVLRSRLEGAGSMSGGLVNGNIDGGGMPTNKVGPTNANGMTAEAKSAVASRVATAMQYKLKKNAIEQQQQQQQKEAVDAVGDAAVSSSVGSNNKVSGVIQTQAQAPPRVRQAMLAAMEYRKKTAEATKAKAVAAAVSAEAGWTQDRLAAIKSSSTITTTTTANSKDDGSASDCVQLPADIVRAQAAAHRAMEEMKNAEAEVRRALRLDTDNDSDDSSEVMAGAAG